MCYFDEVTFTTNVLRKKVCVDIHDFSRDLARNVIPFDERLCIEALHVSMAFSHRHVNFIFQPNNMKFAGCNYLFLVMTQPKFYEI